MSALLQIEERGRSSVVRGSDSATNSKRRLQTRRLRPGERYDRGTRHDRDRRERSNGAQFHVPSRGEASGAHRGVQPVPSQKSPRRQVPKGGELLITTRSAVAATKTSHGEQSHTKQQRPLWAQCI